MCVIRAFLLSLLLFAAASAAERIPLYTYYADPPFSLTTPHSLTKELAQWLSERSRGRYQFEPVMLPRLRLEMLIAQPTWKGVVAWANPVWLNKSLAARQRWTRPYMTDANLVVSLRSAPVNYVDDHSLEGLHLGTVLGFSYPDLERLINAGLITREDVNGEFQNLLKLKAHRVQAVFLQASSFPYFREQFPDMDQWAYISPKPRTVFERSMFLAPGQPALEAFLDKQLELLASDPQWRVRFGAREVRQSAN